MNHGRGSADSPESTNELRSIFEQSVAVLCEGKPGASKDSRGVRIRHNSLPLHTDAADIQKRALDAAAKALASLWRISEPARAKLPGRVMPSSR